MTTNSKRILEFTLPAKPDSILGYVWENLRRWAEIMAPHISLARRRFQAVRSHL